MAVIRFFFSASWSRVVHSQRESVGFFFSELSSILSRKVALLSSGFRYGRESDRRAVISLCILGRLACMAQR